MARRLLFNERMTPIATLKLRTTVSAAGTDEQAPKRDTKHDPAVALVTRDNNALSDRFRNELSASPGLSASEAINRVLHPAVETNRTASAEDTPAVGPRLIVGENWKVGGGLGASSGSSIGSVGYVKGMGWIWSANDSSGRLELGPKNTPATTNNTPAILPDEKTPAFTPEAARAQPGLSTDTSAQPAPVPGTPEFEEQYKKLNDDIDKMRATYGDAPSPGAPSGEPASGSGTSPSPAPSGGDGDGDGDGGGGGDGDGGGSGGGGEDGMADPNSSITRRHLPGHGGIDPVSSTGMEDPNSSVTPHRRPGQGGGSPVSDEGDDGNGGKAAIVDRARAGHALAQTAVIDAEHIAAVGGMTNG